MRFGGQKNHPCDTRLTSGFTLLEMAIVLVIIALITGMAISSGVALVASARITATQNKLQSLHAALTAYRAANERLPCPADITLPTTNALYGLEAANPGLCTGGSPAANFTGTGATNSYARSAEGAFPALSLGLPADMMADGWGNRFRYAVDTSMTAANAFITTPAGCIAGAITVNDAGGNARSQNAIYALLSHGANGHGGYSKNGAIVTAGSSNALELTNCHCSASGASTGYSPTYVQAATAQDPANAYNSFDDLVDYRERWQMQTAWDTTGSCPPPDVIAWTDYSPFLYAYRRSGNSFLPLPPPQPTPAYLARSYGLTISPDNQFVGLVGTSLLIYKITGITMTQSQTLSPFEANDMYHAEFSKNSAYLAIIVASDPTLRIYKNIAGNFALLTSLADYNANTDAVWSPDGIYLAVSRTSAPTLRIYKRSGDTFTLLSGIPQPAGGPQNIWSHPMDWSPDGNYLAVADGSNALNIYSHSGDTFSLAQSLSGSCNTAYTAWSPDSKYISYFDNCGAHIYSWSGTALTAVNSSGYTSFSEQVYNKWGPNSSFMVGPTGSPHYLVGSVFAPTSPVGLTPKFYPVSSPPGYDVFLFFDVRH